MTVITSPDLDTYGRYARASLIADYIELLALKGQAVRQANVADFMADNDWNLELIQSTDDGHGVDRVNALPERLDEAQDTALVVFRQIEERHEVLGDRYPFVIAGEAVSFRENVNPETSAYIAVLAVTIAHAFNVASCHSPSEMFEEIVTNVLRDRGILSSGLAAHRRSAATFDVALHVACKEVGLRASPNAAPRRIRAHDEGVDVLGHVPWEENVRPGTWGFIGQVTVGKSDSWITKIREPSPSEWMLFTGTGVPPSAFLAVPHHVERPTMEWLTSKSGAVVLDRLRLVGFKNTIETAERALIQAVIGEDVEPITG